MVSPRYLIVFIIIAVITCDAYTDIHSNAVDVIGTFEDVVTVTCGNGYDVIGGMTYDIECLIPTPVGPGQWHGIDECKGGFMSVSIELCKLRDYPTINFHL